MQVVEWRGTVDRDRRAAARGSEGGGAVRASSSASRLLGRGHQIDLAGVPRKLGGGSAAGWTMRLQQDRRAAARGMANVSGGQSHPMVLREADPNGITGPPVRACPRGSPSRLLCFGVRWRATRLPRRGRQSLALALLSELAAACLQPTGRDAPAAKAPAMGRPKLFGSSWVTPATALNGVCPRRAGKGHRLLLAFPLPFFSKTVPFLAALQPAGCSRPVSGGAAGRWRRRGLPGLRRGAGSRGASHPCRGPASGWTVPAAAAVAVSLEAWRVCGKGSSRRRSSRRAHEPRRCGRRRQRVMQSTLCSAPRGAGDLITYS